MSSSIIDKNIGVGSAGTSNYVYIQSKEYAWIPARLDRLLSDDKNCKAEVTYVTKWNQEDDIKSGSSAISSFNSRNRTEIIPLKDYMNQTLPLQNVDESGELKEVEDMVDLAFLHEPAILYNLKARHKAGKPYTRTGDIVIAVNPYQWMMHLYSEETRRLYATKLVFGDNSDGSDLRATVPPHVYETSSLAYRGLAFEQQDQSVLVSGESGAGKTETVKILMNHLASVQNAAQLFDIDNASAMNTPGKSIKSDIVQRVLDSNPLLEAFGNAKTVKNDNSSRFGKYLQLQFDAEDPQHAAYAGRSMPRCVMAGSKCEVYLLEKSRVVSHNVGTERSYHIYYQLLASEERSTIWEGLERDMEDFGYVGYTDTHIIEGKSDAERYKLTKEALALIGVEGETFLQLMRAICIVLQLGNQMLEPDPDDEERSIITSTEELESLSSLMGINPEAITKALTERTVRARNEHFMVPLKADKAMDSRDALAKEIYAKTFLWLVRKINDATCAEWNYDKRGSNNMRFGLIGLLDIFGFESFETNRFEQLCINYANEKLQQKFTQDIFMSVQAEYEFEGIPLGQISYEDNVDVLKLVEGRMGLIAILNEECVRPKGADISFVRKVISTCNGNKSGGSSALWMERKFRDCQFGIKHYAANVLYDADGFVQKNMDTLPPDLLECAKQSSNPIVSKELENESMMNKKGSSSSASARKRGLISRKSSTRLVQSTVWSQFRSQLNSLMALLGETRTRYIRCIKPNTEKKPKSMMQSSTMEQLRCAGVVAAVIISRSAFPNRLEHSTVLERFILLKRTRKKYYIDNDNDNNNNSTQEDDVPKMVQQLLGPVLKSLKTKSKEGETEQAFIIGKTRTYFRAGALEFLEAERLEGLLNKAVEIQRFIRKHMAMGSFRVLKNATIYVQAHIRRHQEHQRYLTLRQKTITLQSFVRMIFAKNILLVLRWHHGATQFQKLYRGIVAQRHLTQIRTTVIFIQAMVRGALQRPKYKIDLHEWKEEAKMENQLIALQRRLEEAEERRVEAEKRAEEQAKQQPTEKIVYVNQPTDDDKEEKKHEPTSSSLEKSVVGTPAAAGPDPQDIIPTATAVQTLPANTREMVVADGQTAIVNNIHHHHLTAQQQRLMDESGKMLEHLRKEVFKLRSQNAQLRTDFDLLKDNNQRLMDANANAGASFGALNQHAKQLNKRNTKLTGEVNHLKQLLQKQNLAQVEVKEELKMKQNTYIAEVQSRLTCEKAISNIVDLVTNRCRDQRLVEDILQISDDCEEILAMNLAREEGGAGTEGIMKDKADKTEESEGTK
eukprot:CAMPEP_0194150720 /NCGR_PEP_ID=MMETSP0152-20130528/44846_1 /TAXON_ID=1049557 /ORGANISM="Thalassiothrix antarctica, Strain L6-D1" /LENGTH=1297 /DNA_ID=CAMNT_0038853921 /DNA_START=395 /DNA_END=4289 /DNA_ORIENTATION=+